MDMQPTDLQLRVSQAGSQCSGLSGECWCPRAVGLKRKRLGQSRPRTAVKITCDLPEQHTDRKDLDAAHYH